MPSPADERSLASDYAAMADMFMATPPSFAELLDGLKALEKQLNQAGVE